MITVCLSFDDGRSDSYSTAFKILSGYGLKASFHIVTGFVDGTFKQECFGVGRKPVTINNLLEMHGAGMDVSSHGNDHVMETKDFHLSVKKLKRWGVAKKKYGFSVPNSRYEEKDLRKFVDKTKDMLEYVRVGRSYKCKSFLNKMMFVLYHYFHWYWCFKHFNKQNIIHVFDKFKIVSLVVKKHTRLKDLSRFIDSYKNDDCYLVIMLHSITESPSNEWEWDRNSFDALCSFLSGDCKNIKVDTIEAVVNGLGE